MRQALVTLPSARMRTARHVMAFPFLHDHVRPERIVSATSRDRELFWKQAMQGLEEAPIQYFEFGVHEGQATRWFLAANGHPDSRFYGFDSFTGLPEDWKGGMKAGHFDTGGRMPDLEDERVRFIPGYFDRSLPAFFAGFVPGPGFPVINFDADLYSSTICAMTWILTAFAGRPMLWLFDEFLNEELAAFETMAGAHGLAFDTPCASPDFMRVAIRIAATR